MIHKLSKHLAASKTFIPDFKVAHEFFLLSKSKRKKKSYTPDYFDKIKIHLEMQIMLNQLISLNIEDPVVHGILIQGI